MVRTHRTIAIAAPLPLVAAPAESARIVTDGDTFRSSSGGFRRTDERMGHGRAAI